MVFAYKVWARPSQRTNKVGSGLKRISVFVFLGIYLIADVLLDPRALEGVQVCLWPLVVAKVVSTSL